MRIALAERRKAKGGLKATQKTVSDQHALLLKCAVAVFPDDSAIPNQVDVSPSVPGIPMAMVASVAASVLPIANVPPGAPPMFQGVPSFVAD